MDMFTFFLLGFRVFVSCIGLLGNIFLILSIIHTHMKSFELFLLGLAAANLEEIVIINLYDVMILQTSPTAGGSWSCDLLKFMTETGETCSILFTVIICIFRYQKLRDVSKRVSAPIYLDSIRSAWILSGACVMMSLLICLPIFAINPNGSVENITRNGSGCPRAFFHCDGNYCPKFYSIYKYLFNLIRQLLPLIIVTVTSCLIIAALLSQRRVVTPEVNVSPSHQHNNKSKDARLFRSTVAVVTAMVLFQIDWTLFLIFEWFFSPTEFPFTAEAQFFILTSYTSMSPYVYGIGHHLFSLNNLKRCCYCCRPDMF